MRVDRRSLPPPPPARVNMSDDEGAEAVPVAIPTHETIECEFWGVQVAHIFLNADDVRVVLEPVIKQFYDSNHSGHISRDTKTALQAVLSGLHSQV